MTNASIATHYLTRYFIAYSDGEHERGGVSENAGEVTRGRPIGRLALQIDRR